mgnify:CR=1 FL=1
MGTGVVRKRWWMLTGASCYVVPFASLNPALAAFAVRPPPRTQPSVTFSIKGPLSASPELARVM